MEIFRNFAEFSPSAQPVVFAAGVFDGIHRGHEAVLEKTAEEAKLVGAVPGVLTFHPHPARILRPDACPPALLTRTEKHRLLADRGTRLLLEIEFTPEFAQLPASTFVQALCQACAGQLRGLCAGASWSFGRNREGTMSFLAEQGAALGFAVFPVDAVQVAGEAVSSTRIRRALTEGDLALAAACLGRPVQLTGVVQRGAELGRTIGFPTANLTLSDVQLPPDGVYAVKVHHAGCIHSGVANLGLRPTVQKNQPHRVFEVHLLDFSGDLYGQELHVDLCHYLRPEKKFPSLADLQEQIRLDAEMARALLRGEILPGQP
jgi:riboflavin kinase/FMN adenylyltransferase